MSFEFDPSSHHLTVRPDFEGERAKARAVFLAELLTPGGTMPGDLAPQNWKPVDVEVAPDVTPQTVTTFCKLAGVEVDIRHHE